MAKAKPRRAPQQKKVETTQPSVRKPPAPIPPPPPPKTPEVVIDGTGRRGARQKVIKNLIYLFIFS